MRFPKSQSDKLFRRAALRSALKKELKSFHEGGSSEGLVTLVTHNLQQARVAPGYILKYAQTHGVTKEYHSVVMGILAGVFLERKTGSGMTPPEVKRLLKLMAELTRLVVVKYRQDRQFKAEAHRRTRDLGLPPKIYSIYVEYLFRGMKKAPGDNE